MSQNIKKLLRKQKEQNKLLKKQHEDLENSLWSIKFDAEINAAVNADKSAREFQESLPVETMSVPIPVVLKECKLAEKRIQAYINYNRYETDMRNWAGRLEREGSCHFNFSATEGKIYSGIAKSSNFMTKILAKAKFIERTNLESSYGREWLPEGFDLDIPTDVICEFERWAELAPNINELEQKTKLFISVIHEIEKELFPAPIKNAEPGRLSVFDDEKAGALSFVGDNEKAKMTINRTVRAIVNKAKNAPKIKKVSPNMSLKVKAYLLTAMVMIPIVITVLWAYSHLYGF